MHIYLAIDDTDNHESIGSGHLLHFLAEELTAVGLVEGCSNIIRHQLMFHEDIAYTSHNSAMSISAEVKEPNLELVIAYAQEFLEQSSALGSDPGLCVFMTCGTAEKHDLLDFGKRAKCSIVSKAEAYALARKTGVHLSEHGGSGEGIIGALAAAGLRLGGSDGRFRGWLHPGRSGDIISAGLLRLLPDVDDVVDQSGTPIPEDSLVGVSDDKVKTVFLNHRQVIPVKQSSADEGLKWVTLSRSESKTF